MKIIDTPKCSLGEGPIWHSEIRSWFWLDINAKNLMKADSTGTEVIVYPLPEAASALATISEKSLLLATEFSLATFNFLTQKFDRLTELEISEAHRTNEGGMGPYGEFWFSSMERKPISASGSIFKVNSSIDISNELSGIGIPNTMVWDEKLNRLYLTDSLKRTVYVYSVDNGRLSNKQVFYTESMTNGTPDGGALDVDGNLWIAIWGGSKVLCLSPEGKIISEITVPALQPSSCCFGGDDLSELFITSAREGLDEKQLKESPLSGSSFIVNPGIKGSKVHSFKMS